MGQWWPAEPHWESFFVLLFGDYEGQLEALVCSSEDFSEVGSSTGPVCATSHLIQITCFYTSAMTLHVPQKKLTMQQQVKREIVRYSYNLKWFSMEACFCHGNNKIKAIVSCFSWNCEFISSSVLYMNCEIISHNTLYFVSHDGNNLYY